MLEKVYIDFGLIERNPNISTEKVIAKKEPFDFKFRIFFRHSSY
jgi:hypothetical protein